MFKMLTSQVVFSCLLATSVFISGVNGLLFRKPAPRPGTRVTNAVLKSLDGIQTYSQCTHMCELEYGDACTFVNHHEGNWTCEISDTDLVNPYFYTTSVGVGWSHMISISSGLEWGYYYGGWDLVLKASKHINVGMYNVWTGSTYTTLLTSDLLQLSTPSSQHFKSEKVENWASLNIQKVKLAFFTNGVEGLSLVFDGVGSTKLNWFEKSRLLEDPYDDLSSSATTNFFNMVGWESKRRFYISYNHGCCTCDHGWLVVVEPSGGCSEWDDTITAYPHFAYSTQSTKVNWSQKWGTSGTAFPDIMAIFLMYG